MPLFYLENVAAYRKMGLQRVNFIISITSSEESESLKNGGWSLRLTKKKPRWFNLCLRNRLVPSVSSFQESRTLLRIKMSERRQGLRFIWRKSGKSISAKLLPYIFLPPVRIFISTLCFHFTPYGWVCPSIALHHFTSLLSPLQFYWSKRTFRLTFHVSFS